MAPPRIPKLAVPLEVGTDGRFKTVEQDSVDEVAGCAYAVIATELGSRPEQITFGVEDPTFDQFPLDLSEWAAALEEWEPRAEHEDWRRANAKIAVQIEDRKEPGDFLCLPFGVCHRRLTELHPDLTAVETGIGYAGAFARHRIYESYAWMHVALGRQGHDPDGMDEWAVIPNYFETEDFPAGEPEDYLLYVGRMTDRKGVHLAARVAEATGHELILAGEGEERPAYGDYIGPVGPDARAELMSHAKALICPTRYVEPFGGVAVEAQLCGTPVITTDWGAFTETVEQGSGFRCRTWADFLLAAVDVAGLDRAEIRLRAQDRWSLEAVAPQFESYFNRIEETA